MFDFLQVPLVIHPLLSFVYLLHFFLLVLGAHQGLLLVLQSGITSGGIHTSGDHMEVIGIQPASTMSSFSPLPPTDLELQESFQAFPLSIEQRGDTEADTVASPQGTRGLYCPLGFSGPLPGAAASNQTPLSKELGSEARLISLGK